MKKDTVGAVKQWIIFIVTAAALGTIIWAGLALLNHRSMLPHINAIQSDQTITVGMTDAPQSLDIRTDDDASVQRVLLGNVYETLVTRDQSNKLQPGLAKSWKISDDGLTYTFTLRSGVRFSNGHTMSSSDVVWSMQQAIQHDFIYADDFAYLKNVTNPDDNTVEITLSHTDPRLLRALSGRAGIVYDEQSDIDYAKNSVGTGPFVLANMTSTAITLQRNDDYWSDKAMLSQILLHYYDDDTSLISAFKNGDIQMALPNNAATVSEVADVPNTAITSGVGFEKVMLGYNMSAESPFSDEQVRKMVRYAINASSLTSIADNSYEALGGPISSLEDGYEDLTGLFPYDLTKAQSMRRYFSRSYFDTFTFLVPTQYAQLGQEILAQLQALGFDVAMETVDDATLQTRLQEGSYAIALMTMDEQGDAATFSNAQSVFHYENGDAQRAWDAVMASTNDADYQANLHAYARVVSDNAAADWLYTRKDYVIAANGLSGYPTNMTHEWLPLQGLTMQ